MSRRSSTVSTYEEEDDDDLDDMEDVDDTFLADMASPMKTPHKSAAKLNFFIMKGEPSAETKFISLTQPTSSSHAPKLAKYIVSKDKSLLEIQKCTGQYSWFVNNKVAEDGNISMATTMDPLFHLLERLDHVRARHAASEGKFVTIDQIYTPPELPSLSPLQELVPSSQFAMLCDSKVASGETFYRLNDDKVVEWLKRKVDGICEYLETMPDAISLIRAQVVGYRITDDDKLNNDQIIHLAVGFLKEYVPTPFISKLKNAYGLDVAAIESLYFEDVASRGRKRKADEMGEDFDDVKTPAKKLKKSVSQAKLDKVDKSGMKSLSSFFKTTPK